MSSLAAGPPPQQADKAGVSVTDNDNSAKRASTRVRKPINWPGSIAASASSSSDSVNVAEQDDADHQQHAAAEAKPQSAGQYLMMMETVTVTVTEALVLRPLLEGLIFFQWILCCRINSDLPS